MWWDLKSSEGDDAGYACLARLCFMGPCVYQAQTRTNVRTVVGDS